MYRSWRGHIQNEQLGRPHRLRQGLDADQNLDAQLAALEAARCTMVRTETGDGAVERPLTVQPDGLAV